MVEQKNGNNTAIKVQIEGLKKDIENVTNLNSRIDNAIEKLTDVYSLASEITHDNPKTHFSTFQVKYQILLVSIIKYFHNQLSYVLL